MKLYRGLQDFKAIEGAVVTQGTFDGVHLGHQEILKTVDKLAKKSGSESVLLTFFPHPRLVLYPDDNSLRLINSLDEKARLIEACGIDHMIVLPFTREFSRLSALEFMRDVILESIGMKTFVIGYDHRFGKNREGSIEDVREFSELFDFQVLEIPARDVDESIISSTKIRNALLKGEVEFANTLLGYPFTLHGRVIHGRQQGRALGYPTANIMVEDPYKIIPANGVYIAKVKVYGKMYNAMMSIGNNPTFEHAAWSIEAHLFDFNQDIYDEVVEIKMLKLIREELKFANSEDLKAALRSDENITKAYFSEEDAPLQT